MKITETKKDFFSQSKKNINACPTLASKIFQLAAVSEIKQILQLPNTNSTYQEKLQTLPQTSILFHAMFNPDNQATGDEIQYNLEKLDSKPGSLVHQIAKEISEIQKLILKYPGYISLDKSERQRISELKTREREYGRNELPCYLILDLLQSGVQYYQYKTFETHKERFPEDGMKDLENLLNLFPEAINEGKMIYSIWLASCSPCPVAIGKRITPFMSACLNEKVPVEAVKLLIERGADTKITFGKENTLFTEYFFNEYRSVVVRLNANQKILDRIDEIKALIEK